VVGLGNPGERYSGTRHNVGYMVVDALARRLGVSFKKKIFRSYSSGKGTHEGRSLHLVKPLSFMNNSGRAVREALRETRGALSEMLVVCDSLDLSPGTIRLKLKGSSGGQKGLQSIIQSLGTEDFMRLSIGIGRPRQKEKVIAHVLGSPRRHEEELIASAVEKAAQAALLLLTEGPARVMNEVNRKEPPS
jgi:PTH1 family peptidyl-tRNA hydrolase